jgi:hypothetical protein
VPFVVDFAIFWIVGLAKHLEKNNFGWQDGQKVGFRY